MAGLDPAIQAPVATGTTVAITGSSPVMTRRAVLVGEFRDLACGEPRNDNLKGNTACVS
jgi:hypothetical protein